MTDILPVPLAETTNPCLFIVGCLRSGTTMFRHIVDAHPQLAVVNGTQWLPRWFEHRRWKPGLADDGRVSQAVLPELLALERFSRLDVSAAEIEGWFASGQPLPG